MKMLWWLRGLKSFRSPNGSISRAMAISTGKSNREVKEQAAGADIEMAVVRTQRESEYTEPTLRAYHKELQCNQSHTETRLRKVVRIQPDCEHKEPTLGACHKEELQRNQSQAENKLRKIVNDSHKKYELENRNVTNAKKQKVVRIQPDCEHKEPTLGACHKEELQRNQSQAENKLRKIVNDSHKKYELENRNVTNAKKQKSSSCGNTALVLLDEYNLVGSKRSFDRAIKKAQSWCKENSTCRDLSKHLGIEAEVYTTPPRGTFHMSFLYRRRKNKKALVTERLLTIFLSGKDLYFRGWRSRNGIFEIQSKRQDYNYIKDLACIIMPIGENYHDYLPHGDLDKVRIGPFGIMNHFDVLEKCQGETSDAVLAAIAGFAVNSSECIRLAEVKEEVLEAYDNYHLVYLGTRGSNLSMRIRKYSQCSRQYLKCVDALVTGKPVPPIKNCGDINSLEDLMKKITVPLRARFSSVTFGDEEVAEYDSWSPPSLDSMEEDQYWVAEDKKLEEEEEDEDESEDNEDTNENEVDQEVIEDCDEEELEDDARIYEIKHDSSNLETSSSFRFAADTMFFERRYTKMFSAAFELKSAGPNCYVTEFRNRLRGHTDQRVLAQKNHLQRFLQVPHKFRNAMKAISFLKWFLR